MRTEYRKDVLQRTKLRDAAGLLLGFIRRRLKLSQKELAASAGLNSASEIANFESGARAIPNVLLECLKILHVNNHFIELLLNLEFGQVKAEDVLTGFPIFVRSIEEEFNSQPLVAPKRIWYLTDGVLLLQETVREMIKKQSLTSEVTIFVPAYKVSRLSSLFVEKNLPQPGIFWIGVTPELCLQDYIIYEPAELNSIGRVVCKMGGRAIGTYGIDHHQVRSIEDALTEPLFRNGKFLYL